MQYISRINFDYYINILRNAEADETFSYVRNDENISELYYGLIDILTNTLMCDAVAHTYVSGEVNWWFFPEYIIEDFVTYGKAYVPIFADTTTPIPVGSDLEPELNKNHGIALNTADEVYDFFTKCKLPEREFEYISPNYAIRRSQN